MEIIPFEKSVASHPKGAKYWSQKNIDPNGNFIKPESILKKSKEICKFDCDVCNHTFLAKPNNITHSTQPTWCQYCAGMIICLEDNCMFCFYKSFASNELSKSLHPDCKVNPRSVFKGAKLICKFICPNPSCNHEFDKNLMDVQHGYFCPYCPNSGKKKLCDDEKCVNCLKQSFASHPRAEFWSQKNTITPRKVSRGSSQVKYWFDCIVCNNDFEMSPCHILEGKWCPYCKNKTETLLFNQLSKSYKNIEFQYYTDWCRSLSTNAKLPFDFVIHDYKVIIELDGEQHFIQVGKWKSPEEQRKIDLYKMKCANENGYSVIRIFQKDVLKDRIDWLRTLQESIHEIIDRDTIHNYFISFDENLYKEFINK